MVTNSNPTLNPSEPEQEHIAEAVVGVFDTSSQAKAAITKLKANGIEFAEIDKDWSGAEVDPAHGIYSLFYSPTHGVETSDVANGVAKGAAIGLASGLLFAAVPVFNIIAPLAGMLGGGLVGGMAGIDEANRHSKLPNLVDYQTMLAAGKGLVIVNGDETFRIRIGNELKALSAANVYQHPPILHLFDSKPADSHPAADGPISNQEKSVS